MIHGACRLLRHILLFFARDDSGRRTAAHQMELVEVCRSTCAVKIVFKLGLLIYSIIVYCLDLAPVICTCFVLFLFFWQILLFPHTTASVET